LRGRILAEIEAGSPHYEENQNLNVRALVRLARGDNDGALADTARSVARAREVKDAQNLCPTLAVRAFVLLSTGQADPARRLATEVLENWSGVEQVVLTWGGAGALAAIAALGKRNPLETLGAESSGRSRWVAAAEGYLAGDLERAAEIFERIGSLPDAAYTRLTAAERFVADGQNAEAEAQRQKALVFYRSVGATRYIREAEVLLAANK
jgi:tetratricopeptide (TPR) repeat protein